MERRKIKQYKFSDLDVDSVSYNTPVYLAADVNALAIAAEKVKTAWESLKEGHHSPKIIETWLVEKMKPAMQALRKALDESVVQTYNPNYGDDRMCKCGHSYYRHFDTYGNMEAIGCKYCTCFEFEER